MNITVHDVVSVELVSFMPNNNNARTVSITCRDMMSGESTHLLTFFGETDALDALPKSSSYADWPYIPTSGEV